MSILEPRAFGANDLVPGKRLTLFNGVILFNDNGVIDQNKKKPDHRGPKIKQVKGDSNGEYESEGHKEGRNDPASNKAEKRSSGEDGKVMAKALPSIF